MAAGEMNPTEYIGHHLTHGTASFGGGGFWSINFDSISVSVALGVLGVGFLWWVVRGATAGAGADNQRQRAGVQHGGGHRRRSDNEDRRL